MLPKLPATDPTVLYRYRDAICASDALVVALGELDLLSVLAMQPATVPELARRLHLAERPLDVVVTLLAALGLVEREPVVRCTALAEDHLVHGSPFFLGPYYASLKGRPQARQMLQVMRSGQPASWGDSEEPSWVDAMQDEAFADAFTAAMDCRGAYLAPALAKAVNLDGCQHVLDIAGGSGIYACSLVAARPALRATVLERPPMDRVARRHIARRGFSQQVEVVAADMSSDPYPPGCDVHLLSNVLHDWGEATVRRLLARSAAHLPAGGRLVIHDAHLNADKSGPLEVAEYSVFLMHATEGRCYSVSELSAWLTEAGLVYESCAPTAAHRSAVVASKA